MSYLEPLYQLIILLIVGIIIMLLLYWIAVGVLIVGFLTGVSNMTCTNCGKDILPERFELGYHYCMEHECIRKCMPTPRVAVIGVHKSNPQVVSIDDALFTANVSYMRHK
jgi:hypothetical protein